MISVKSLIQGWNINFCWKVLKDNLVCLKNVFDGTLNFKDPSRTS